MLSLLQLKYYTLEKLIFQSGVTAPDPGADGYDIDIKPAAAVAIENDRFFKVVLDIRVKAKRKKSPVKKLEIALTGYFELSEKATEKEKKQLIPVNCIAILIGIARGLAANVTGNLPFGPFILPVINLLDNEANEKEEQKSQE